MFTLGDRLQDYANGKTQDSTPQDNGYWNYLIEENSNLTELMDSMKYEIKVSRR